MEGLLMGIIKKITKGVFVSLMALSAFSVKNVLDVSAETIDEAMMNCDVNEDNDLDARDISYLKKAILNEEKCTSSCDVNGDGKVNFFDLLYLKRLIVNDEIVSSNSIATLKSSSEHVGIEYTAKTRSVLLNTGKINWHSEAKYCVTDYIDVSDYKVLKIQGSTGYSNALYAFYDENKSLLSLYKTTNTGPYQVETHDFVSVPNSAKYLVVNYNRAYGNAIIEDITDNYFVSNPSADEKKWSNITWVTFGDSLTESNSRAEKQYYDYVSEETGISVINFGKSGSGYAKSSENFYTRVNQLENVDFDVITFFGSFNDLSAGVPIGTADDTELTTLGGYINATLDRLYEIKPFVKVGIITPTPWNNNNTDNSFRYYSELLVNIGKKRGIPVLDLYTTSQLYPWDERFRDEFYNENGFQDEGVHPNSKGHKRIYPQFREFLANLI